MGKARKVLRQATVFMLVISLLMTVLSVGVYAATEDNNDPKVIDVKMNETRTYITLRFDREIEAAGTLTGKIKLSKEGKSPVAISSSSKVVISGYDMHITLTSPLTTADNYFSINAGTLVNQKEVIETDLFDARGPELIEKNAVVINSADNTVTIKFNCSIKGFPNNDSLKNGYISLARSGSSFSEIIPKDDISINSEKGEITIYLEEWLSGSRAKFRIAAGKLQNSVTGNINLNDITTSAIDASNTTATPELDYVEVAADKANITIYFTGKIRNSYSTGVSSSTANSLLKSHILLSRGSANKYESLSGADTLTIGSNYLKIKLAEPLTSSRNYIKIEKTSLTDYYGNYIFEDIVTDNITNGMSSSSATPAYASAFLSSSKKIVIYFTTPIQKSSSLTTSDLRSNISVSRNGGSYQSLTSYDSVTFSDNAMTITLREELTGTGNRVKINANTLSSQSGVLLSKSVTTSSLSAGMSDSDDYDNPPTYDDEGAPEYETITYDSSAQRVRITFDRDIKKVSSADFKENIYVSRNGGSFTSLAVNDVVTISPSNALTILLSEPLSGTKNAFKISGNTIADYDTGYVQNSSITTDYISASGSSSSSSSTPSNSGTAYSGNVKATLSDDFYSVTIKFDEAVYNNMDSIDDLKNKIQISRNGSFKTLSSNDYVRLDSANNELFIMLSEPANEYNSQIKIASGALRNADGGSYTGTISTLPLGEADGNMRTYIDGVAVADMASLQLEGTNAVVSVSGLAKFNSYAKGIEFLVKVPSTANGATLNIAGDIAEHIKRYGGTAALSLGSETYYLPAANIPSITTSDTLSISIVNAPSNATQKLASASSTDSFKIETPAKKLVAKLVSASGSETAITHTAFANKRFMLANPTANQSAFTAVRIEDSGIIAPVPSKSEVIGGVVYITSNTTLDGNYAVISASHTLSTLSWAQSPTNALASRLILTNATGSTLNGSEAVNRAETATIMVRTLGVLKDANGTNPFFDIISSDNFYTPVMSAYSYELILGFPDGTFMPDKKLTRAEAMTIVARAMRFMKGKSVSASPDISLSQANSILSKFTDAGTVDDWAKVDIAECVQAGVVNGDNKGRLNPKSNVTRAELIQLMYNILTTSDII